METIVSVLNLKAGVGCSLLTWNIAQILELDIYEHENGLHHYFLQKRNETVKNGELYESLIDANPINKRKYSSGIYDLGSDINYAYVRNILKKSSAIVIPTDNGYETLLKTIATINYVKENTQAMIFVVFNRLDNSSNVDREKKYTYEAKQLIQSHINLTIDKDIQFLHVRQSFSLIRNQGKGYFFLDNYVKQKEDWEAISPFNVLRNLRYHTVSKRLNSKRKDKASKQLEETDFFKHHKFFFEDYQKKSKFDSINDFSKIYDFKFNNKNNKTIKDMLILTTRIKAQYSRLWEY